jgi:hypothetical protein
MCDRRFLVCSVLDFFVIEIEALLPVRLSYLLGVPHLFVHFGIVLFVYTCVVYTAAPNVFQFRVRLTSLLSCLVVSRSAFVVPLIVPERHGDFLKLFR